MTQYQIEDKFRQAEAAGGPAYLRVSATHEVDLFAGTEDSRRALLLICGQEPPPPPVLELLAVMRRKRDDGRWALLVVLQRKDLGEIFAYLVEDLATVTAGETDCGKAARQLIERLKWWQRLLGRGRSEILGEQELRGLVGELLFLRDCAIPEMGARSAVNSWVGPLDAPRDFRFPEIDVEVKALQRDAVVVRISSSEQLEPAGGPITLATVVLESVAHSYAGAFNVKELVAAVRRLCEPDIDIADALSKCLWAAGYVDRDEYAQIHFVSRAPLFYDCNEEFPRITRDRLPTGIIECTYQVSIGAIEPFRIRDWKLR